jgi:hypothetical protein
MKKEYKWHPTVSNLVASRVDPQSFTKFIHTKVNKELNVEVM